MRDDPRNKAGERLFGPVIIIGLYGNGHSIVRYRGPSPGEDMGNIRRANKIYDVL